MEEQEELSVSDAAFARSGLPVASGDGGPLGSESWDEYVYRVLKLAGITVELVNLPTYEMESDIALHTSVQIVTHSSVKEAMERSELEEISFAESDEMDGLQVKLNFSCGWKVSILEEIPDRASFRADGPSSTSRKRSAAADAATVIQSRHLYEIVVGCSKEGQPTSLRTTVAAAQVITINMAFKLDDDQTPVLIEGWPVIDQRRVDVVFTNKHVVKTQVRSVFCVLCSVFCCLQPT